MKRRVWVIPVVVLLTVSVAVYALASDSGSIFDGLFSGLTKGDTVTISREEYERLKKYDKLDEISDYIEQYYYIEPDTDKMMKWAIDGMLASLNDPYTFYYDADSWKSMWEEDEGEYAGVGIQMLGNYETDTVTISRVFKGTPAESAGIRKGDILKRVNDLTVTTQTMNDAVSIMRGGDGETVEIEVERRGEPLTFTVARAQIKINWIESKMLEDNVGYICLYEFAGDCATAFEAEVKSLEEQGATSLVVDLRDNGGGWVADALSIADIFLDKTLFFYSEDRAGKREESYTTDGKDDIPLVLLVNEGSASSSEILSGGLQDAGRAKLVGTQTYGKGIIQYVISLSDQTDGMQFTYAQYYMPSGKPVHKVGITPDLTVEMPEDFVGTYFDLGDMTDPQLKAAWEEAVAQRALAPAAEETPAPDDETVSVPEDAQSASLTDLLSVIQQMKCCA